jgi:hypothetical protein
MAGRIEQLNFENIFVLRFFVSRRGAKAAKGEGGD